MDKKSFLKGLLCGIGASLVALFVAVGVFSCASGAISKKEETSGVKALREVPKKVNDYSYYGDIPSLHGWRYVDYDHWENAFLNEASNYDDTMSVSDYSVSLFGHFKVFAYDGSLWEGDSITMRFNYDGNWQASTYVSVAKWDNADDLDFVPNQNGDYSSVCVGYAEVDTHDLDVTSSSYDISLFYVDYIDWVSWGWLSYVSQANLATYFTQIFASCPLGYGVGDSFVVDIVAFYESFVYLHGDISYRNAGVSYYGSGLRLDGDEFAIGYGADPSIMRIRFSPIYEYGYVEVEIGSLGVDSATLAWLNQNASRVVSPSVGYERVVWGANFRPAMLLQTFLNGGLLVFDGFGLSYEGNVGPLNVSFDRLVYIDGVPYDSVYFDYQYIDVSSDLTRYSYGGSALDIQLTGSQKIMFVTGITFQSLNGNKYVAYQCVADYVKGQDSFGDDTYFGYWRYDIKGRVHGDWFAMEVPEYDGKNVLTTYSNGMRFTEYSFFEYPSTYVVAVDGYNWFGSTIDPFELLKSGIGSMVNLLSINVLPGLSLGLLFSLPLLALLVVLVFKVVHK